VIATDDAGAVIYWGPGAERLYGWTEGEALGHNVLDLTPSELGRDEAALIMRTLQDGQPWRGEFIVHDRNGARFTAEVTDWPVCNEMGRLIGIVGVSRRTSYITAG
jgi:PAS domain S-box-containing protein